MELIQSLDSQQFYIFFRFKYYLVLAERLLSSAI